MVDQHDPTIISINAVIASLQSQEALKLMHHVKGIELGTVNPEYVIYNGLVGKFFYIGKEVTLQLPYSSRRNQFFVRIWNISSNPERIVSR